MTIISTSWVCQCACTVQNCLIIKTVTKQPAALEGSDLNWSANSTKTSQHINNHRPLFVRGIPWNSLLGRAVGNDHFYDTTKRASLRLTSYLKGEIPLYHRSGDKPLDPTTLLLGGSLCWVQCCRVYSAEAAAPEG